MRATSIKDNGAGRELHQYQTGIGIQKILSRVETLGGLIDLSGLTGDGCQLTITIPLQTGKEALN